MRMFFYYFVHTSWNQLRTFVRTWAFGLFLLLVWAGSALYYGFRWYYGRLAAENDALPTDINEFFEVTGLSGLDFLELAVGLLILLLLIIQIIGAEKSVANLFKQADVNMLFASDLPPQTVLAFRVTNTLGLAIAAGAILAIRLPFLAGEYSLTAYGAGSILLGWCITLAFCVLLKMMIYEIGSRHPFFRRNFRWVVFGSLAGIGYAFYRMYQMDADQDLFRTAQRFFNAKQTRLIPVWGWTKGMMMYALEGNVSLSLGLLFLNLALIAILVGVVRKLPADYYEETLSRAQETAMLEQAAISDGAALLVMQARSHEVKREGIGHGKGSRIYFFRVLHNRMRTSNFLVTRTMLTYSCAALAAGLYVRYILDDPIEYIPVLVLAAMVFFHTIISPVTEDIRMTTFLLQPDSIWKKLFFSLLGGSCNCALDVLIPLMIGQAAAGYSPLGGLLYLPVLAGVDFFASASGAFTDVSIPSSIGTSFKQVIQILLLYVGLIFDGAFLLYGINSGHGRAGFILVTVLNLLIGMVFLGLTGVWLYPCRGRAVKSKDYVPDNKGARRCYAQVGVALTTMFLAIKLAQGSLAVSGAEQVITLYLPIYLIGLPMFWLIMGLGQAKSHNAGGGVKQLTLREFLLVLSACFFVMYAGNLLGYLLQGLIRMLVRRPLMIWDFGVNYADLPVHRFSEAMQAVLLAFAAPVMEEFVFRKCVIGRVRPYGEKAALVTSALFFALFHGSVNQVCYAFLLGLIFGYVYLKTGRLRYSILLHVIINSMTVIILPALTAANMSLMGSEDVSLSQVIFEPAVLALVIYVVLIIILSMLGAVVFFFGLWENELSADSVRIRDAISSWGTMLFLLVTIVGVL